MSPDSAPTWFGQPRGLTILFRTEMWEPVTGVSDDAAAARGLAKTGRTLRDAQNGHRRAPFFAILAVLAMAAGALLLTLDRSTSRIESER